MVVTVIDDAGTSIPGALATVSSPAVIGGALQGTTDENGMVAFPNRRPGEYRVVAQKRGFGSVSRTEILVELGRGTMIVVEPKAGGDTVITPEQRKTIDISGPTCDGASDYPRWWCMNDGRFLARIPTGRSYEETTAHADGAAPAE